MAMNIAIVNYNTTTLLTALLKSIKKFVPSEPNIYIFDNSNKEPCYTTTEPNITVFDNTHGYIINFDTELEKYPDRFLSSGTHNNFGSAKHCMTIEKIMELIDDDVMLLDSDVLLKRDITPLYDKEYAVVADTEGLPPKQTRMIPYVEFLNIKMLKENGVHYFDGGRMHGLHVGHTPPELYDTGASLYEDVMKKQLPFKQIKYKDYIVHLKAGSWARSQDFYLKRFLRQYKHLFEDGEVTGSQKHQRPSKNPYSYNPVANKAAYNVKRIKTNISPL